MKKLWCSLIIFWCFYLGAHPCDQINLDTVASQSGGRVKPIFVLAKEHLDFIFAEKPQDTPSVLFCKLSLLSQIDFAQKTEFLFKIEHPEAKKFLNMDSKAKGLAVNVLVEKEEELRREYMSRKLNDGLKKEYNKILIRLQTFMSIVNGENWTIYQNEKWVPINSLFVQWKENNFNNFATLLTSAQISYETQHNKKHHWEYYYFKSKPYAVAIFITLLSMILLISLPKTHWGMVLAGLSLFMQLAAITVRILISERAPITNMYETVIFSGFGALCISFILFLIKKEKIYLLAGLSYNFLTLLMSIFANNMLSSAISPLVPVLRDNFWLSTHVTTVILSYAALSVSWILANLVIVQKILKFKIFDHYQEKNMIPLIYNCVKIGVVLLSAGVILGGVWADYSWGRFWGWDPKETWSLIVLLIYMAILHGKKTTWISPSRFIPLIAFAFLSVMMAWFGVNYILASGLHSYGFSEGGAIFLMSFFIIQMTLLGLYFAKNKFLRN